MSKTDPKFPSLFTRAVITIALRNRMVGGIPTNPKLIEGWLAANMPSVDEAERAKLATATAAELPAVTEEAAEGMWTTFKRDEKGVFIEGRQVKSMLKECANILRDLLMKSEQKGEAKKSRFTNLKSKTAERVFVEEDKIHFFRPDEKGAVTFLSKPDGTEERAIHVMTAQGPRSALKRFDFVQAPASLTFTVKILNDGVMDLDLLKYLLEYGGWNGLGADRSQGNGLFDVSSIAVLGA